MSVKKMSGELDTKEKRQKISRDQGKDILCRLSIKKHLPAPNAPPRYFPASTKVTFLNVIDC